MKTVSQTEAQKTFDTVMDSGLVEPVMVSKSGRPSVVIMSVTEYKRLIAMEDASWTSRAFKAEESGFASEIEVQQLIKRAHSA